MDAVTHVIPLLLSAVGLQHMHPQAALLSEVRPTDSTDSWPGVAVSLQMILDLVLLSKTFLYIRASVSSLL